MAKKKSKTDASPETTAAPTQAGENVTVAASSVDSAVVVEPVAKKASRSTKKAQKSPTPVAEELSVATESLENKARSTKKAEIIAPEEVTTVTKKIEKEATPEKTKKTKRLTLDIPKSLHKAIKAQAVEEGISIVDMLRTLLEQHYGK